MPKTLGPSTETTGIQICLLKVNLMCLTKECTTTHYLWQMQYQHTYFKELSAYYCICAYRTNCCSSGTLYV